MIGSTERRTMVAAGAIGIALAAAIVALGVLGRGGGAERPASAASSAEQRNAARACRERFAVGFSRAFIEAACPIYVPRALAGASNREIVALPEFREEICVEAGRIRYESGEVATRLDLEEWLVGVRRDCRREIRE